jgi:hypothetical protein
MKARAFLSLTQVLVEGEERGSGRREERGEKRGEHKGAGGAACDRTTKRKKKTTKRLALHVGVIGSVFLGRKIWGGETAGSM